MARDAAERKNSYGLISAKMYPSLITIMDCTYQYLHPSSVKELFHVFYSGHKKQSLWLHQLIVDWRGKILHHSFVPGGVTSDRGQFNATLLDDLPHMFSPGEQMLTDGGYQGVNPNNILLRCNEGHPLTGNLRAAIERVNNLVKDRWKLCNESWPKTASVWHAPMAFHAAVLLTNFLNRLRDRYSTNP